MQYRDYHDFCGNAPSGQRLLHDSVVGSTTARLLYVSRPAGTFTDPPLPEFVAFLGVTGASRLSFDCACGHWEGVWRAGDLSMSPPDTTTSLSIDEPHAFLALTLPALFVASALHDLIPDRPTSFGNLHAATFRDATVARYCKELWRLAKAGRDVGDKLSCDSVLLAAIFALARKAHSRVAEVGSKLDGQVLVRTLDFVEDHLADNLSLAELAAVADLSPMHFARKFRQATGLSPHQYVLRSRIARAKALLSVTRHQLADIALAVGFSSQAHMTAVFSRNIGITPLRYRKQRQS